ncbi:PKD domain-containing protein [Vibrio galatheae]|uniref:PKD domain-containing protein n=1 Tax=Vibrio galatheae TaxID=579748 RepID=UPI0005F9C27F|nr:hypothetical protein [Vibrio galatheae]
MSMFVKYLVLGALIVLSGCDDDIGDAEKYTKPTVDAGSDKVYTLPISKITLSGSAKTYPKHVYSIKDTKWTQTSGPENLTILNSDSLTATLLNPETTGTYTFELYVKDSGDRTNTDRVKIVLTQSAKVASARSSRSYSDDYNLMWNTVAEDQVRYPEIEDQWQALYQPYLIEVEQITSDTQWHKLVTKMISDLNTGQLELRTIDSNLSGRDSTVEHVTWSQDNGIGTVRFDSLGNISSQELLVGLTKALSSLSSTQQIKLDFRTSGVFNDQLLLTLITRLTTRHFNLCLAESEQEVDCIQIQANKDVSETRFEVVGAESSLSAQQFARFIDFVSLGGERFEFLTSLPLTTKLVLH